MQAFNSGIIETGDNSVGIRMNGVREDVPYTGQVLVPDPNSPYDDYYVDVSGTVDVTSPSYLSNSGTIRVGANSTAVEITGTAASNEFPLLFNTGTIEAIQGGSSTAIRLNANNSIDSFAVNVGTIAGNITFGAGNDRLTNTLMVDDAGRVTHSGNIIMNGSVIDFGAGDNVFDNDRGMITIAGGDNLITGANVVMTQGSIEARNNAVDSSLTIDGNLSGDFAFGADFNGGGSDQLIITGDVADGSSMSVVLNPTEQLSGETSFTVITVGGENDGGRAHHRGRDRKLRRQPAGRRGELLRGDRRDHRDGALRHGTHGDVRGVGDHHGAALVDAVGRQPRPARHAATRGPGRFRTVGVGRDLPRGRLGRSHQRSAGRQLRSETLRPADRHRVEGRRRRRQLQCRPDVQLRQCVREPERQPCERDGRRLGLRPERRLSVQERPVPERDLAADGDGDRLQDAGYVVERDRQRPMPRATASMSSWATRTS